MKWRPCPAVRWLEQDYYTWVVEATDPDDDGLCYTRVWNDIHYLDRENGSPMFDLRTDGEAPGYHECRKCEDQGHTEGHYDKHVPMPLPYGYTIAIEAVRFKVDS